MIEVSGKVSTSPSRASAVLPLVPTRGHCFLFHHCMPWLLEALGPTRAVPKPLPMATTAATILHAPCTDSSSLTVMPTAALLEEGNALSVPFGLSPKHGPKQCWLVFQTLTEMHDRSSDMFTCSFSSRTLMGAAGMWTPLHLNHLCFRPLGHCPWAGLCAWISVLRTSSFPGGSNGPSSKEVPARPTPPVLSLCKWIQLAKRDHSPIRTLGTKTCSNYLLPVLGLPSLNPKTHRKLLENQVGWLPQSKPRRFSPLEADFSEWEVTAAPCSPLPTHHRQSRKSRPATHSCCGTAGSSQQFCVTSADLPGLK